MNTFTKKPLLKAMRLVIGASIFSQCAYAFAEEEEVKSTRTADVLEEEVIVTGVLSAGGMRRLDTTFANTTMNEEEIKRYAPQTAGELMNAIPGIFTETGFGNAGVATRVRGISSGDGNLASFSINGAPVFPVNAMEGIEHGGLIRYDETVKRVESIVSGMSSISGQGQPGLTSNYVLKEGSEEDVGLAKLTTSDYGLLRFDGLVSGQLSEGLFYMLGGYVERSSDFRDAEFDSGEGRQFTINITKEFESGTVNFYTRDLEDSTAYSLFMPVGRSLDSIPGFEPGHDTLLGQSLRFQEIATDANGTTKTYDLKDGRVTDVTISGLSANIDLADGWTLRNNMNFTSGGTNNAFLVPLWARPVSSEGPLGGLPDGRAGAGGSAVEVTSGRVLNSDELVYQSRIWIQDTEIESMTNDLSISKEFDNHTFTAGLYLSNFENRYFQNRGTNLYHTVEPNAQRVDLIQANGDRTQNGQSEYVGWGPVGRGAVDGQATALYVSDIWSITDNWSIDGSIRYESMEMETVLDTCNFDACDLVALSTGIEVRMIDGIVDQVNKYDDSELSWSLATNVSVSDSSSMYLRAGEGHLMPQPQDVEDTENNEASVMEQVEFGYKLATDSFDLFATAYRLEYTAPSLSSEEGVIVRRNSSTRSTGVELDGTIRAGEFELGLVAGWIDAEFTESTDPTIIGKQPQRTPEFTFRASPSYRFDLSDDSDLVVFGALQAFGERWANNQNTGEKIPSYETIDLGATWNSGNFNVQFVAKNITDEIGLTEGRPQTSEEITPFAVLVPGRIMKLSIAYNF